MINKTDSGECSGCTACYAICPQNAIIMKANEQGFKVPDICHEKCIECGLCDSVCPVNNKRIFTHKAYYAAKNIDNIVRTISSSGGVSSAICKWIIMNGGAVYGVQYDDNFKVVTKRAVTSEQCDAFKGSKYVQTDEKNTFRETENDLREGRWVAFFSTSCHINGLINYLSQKNVSATKLITVDLICHGVPSPLIFREYIEFLNKKKAIKQFDFRTKERGWGKGSWNFGCRILYRDGKKEVDTLKSRLFLNLFFGNYCLRPNCYGCIYSGNGRAADITIADFWGINEAIPEFADTNGISLVMVQNKKGDAFLKQLDELEIVQVTEEKAARKQANMHRPSPKNIMYEQFWKDYKEKNFKYIIKKYASYTVIGKIKYMLKQFLFGVGILKG